MKLSERWLREWVNPTYATAELVTQLTMIGLEVEHVAPVAQRLTQVVVGEILTVEPHPQAEKLKICQVNIGDNTPLTLVCGAPNVDVGLRVATALVGAQLPGGTVEAMRFQGVDSQGMLCSPAELGLGDAHEGIMLLPVEMPIGAELYDCLQLNDVSIEVELTPNRGDCLSVAGIARELGALTRLPVHAAAIPAIEATIDTIFPVTIHEPQACPRYVGRVIENINIQAPTPLWMQERLRRSGLRSINAVVDVTNYVLLEWGQPMHAFDLEKLTGEIQVRNAQADETLTLLDEQTIRLDEQTLVIADAQQPVALAGVMGGLASAVSDTTSHIFLESAFFTPQTLSGCARRYGLQTDSAYRFERGVDWQLQRQAVERATALLLAIVGGQPGTVIERVEASTLPATPTITLRADRIRRILGQALQPQAVNDILTRLGMTVSGGPEQWQVDPPSFRFDIDLEIDLIEELARLHGYNNLPIRLPQSALKLHPPPPLTLNRWQAALIERGYQEAITYSFVDPKLQAYIDPEQDAIPLVNPLASDMAVMRTTLWVGLLKVLQYNQKRQQQRVRLFEIGLRFLKGKNNKIQQDKMIAAVISGAALPQQWGSAERPSDFFDVKADVETLLHHAGYQQRYRFVSSTHPALHPGQTAAIYCGDEPIGLLGALHPNLIQLLELIPPVYVFELQVAPLIQIHVSKFKEISKYPSVRRDLALVVPQQLAAAQLLDYISHQAPEHLQAVHLFDCYQGQGIKSGYKSLAIGLVFQALSRSLTEAEVDTVITQVLDNLNKDLGAQLRK